MASRKKSAIWALAACVVLVALLANFVMIDTPATVPASHGSPREIREVAKPTAQSIDADGGNREHVADAFFSRLQKVQEQTTKAGKPRLHLCEILRHICRGVAITRETHMRAQHMCMKRHLELLLPDSELLRRIRAQVIYLLHFARSIY